MLRKQNSLVPFQRVKRYFWIKAMQWFLSISSVAGHSSSEDGESGDTSVGNRSPASNPSSAPGP